MRVSASYSGSSMRRSRIGNVEDRFWVRVRKGGPDECWDWTGTLSNWGYGRIGGKLHGERVAKPGSTALAHRVSWIMANGPIPEGGPEPHGWVVMHTCDNRLCVNPAHLVLGTQERNVKDMDEKKRGKRVSPRHGIDNPMAILSAEQEAEILASRDSSRKLGLLYGVDKSVILRVRRNALTVEQRADLRRENYRKR